ncbi:MAG: hypothetical protein ACR2LG_07555 [Actinomycetota bacterium]|nr:hypothetical protein [Actinomycetota bacterium]
MRLAVVETGHRLSNRLFLGLIRVIGRREPPDVMKTLHYRPSFFGSPFSNALQIAMRGPSEWSVGERELFAALTSRLNQCIF